MGKFAFYVRNARVCFARMFCYTPLMSRTGTLILVGILTIVTPYSGLPVSVRSMLSIAFGAVVVSIGLSLRAKEAKELDTAGVVSASQNEESPHQAIG